MAQSGSERRRGGSRIRTSTAASRRTVQPWNPGRTHHFKPTPKWK